MRTIVDAGSRAPTISVATARRRADGINAVLLHRSTNISSAIGAAISRLWWPSYTQPSIDFLFLFLVISRLDVACFGFHQNGQFRFLTWYLMQLKLA
jgi:hypothetical protein